MWLQVHIRKPPGLHGFPAEFYLNVKKKSVTVIYTILGHSKKEKVPSSLYKTSIILMPEKFKEEKYRLIFK